MINLLIFITSPLYMDVKINIPTNLFKQDLEQLLQAFKQYGQNPLDEKQWKFTIIDNNITFMFKETGSFITLKDDRQEHKIFDIITLYSELYKNIFKGDNYVR